MKIARWTQRLAQYNINDVGGVRIHTPPRSRLASRTPWVRAGAVRTPTQLQTPYWNTAHAAI